MSMCHSNTRRKATATPPTYTVARGVWNTLKENKNKLYTDLEQIKKEVDMARNTFKKYKWPFIDVTRKSVEETAASVVKIYEIYKENA